MHHGALVRLTINLKENLYRAAKSKAIIEDCSISDAVNRMLEQTLMGQAKPRGESGKGFPIVPSRPFGSADVYRIDLEQS